MNDDLQLVEEDYFFHSRELHDTTPSLIITPAGEAIVIETCDQRELSLSHHESESC